MKIKNLIKYLAVVVLMVSLLFVLTACSNNEEVEANNDGEFGEDVAEMPTPPSIDTWPKEFYDKFGIPEYKYGEIFVAVPNDRSGKVQIDTTYEDFSKYVKELRDKGYRINQEDLDELNEMTEPYISGKIFDPKVGKGYALEYFYSPKPIEETISADILEMEFGILPEYVYDEYGDIIDKKPLEDRVGKYTLVLTVYQPEEEEEKIDIKAVSKLGFKEDDVTPSFKAKRMYTEEHDDFMNIIITKGFDDEITIDEAEESLGKFLKACVRISDDGKAYNIENEAIENPDEYTMNYWEYNYQNNRYKVHVEYEKGFGKSLVFAVTKK